MQFSVFQVMSSICACFAVWLCPFSSVFPSFMLRESLWGRGPFLLFWPIWVIINRVIWVIRNRARKGREADQLYTHSFSNLTSDTGSLKSQSWVRQISCSCEAELQSYNQLLSERWKVQIEHTEHISLQVEDSGREWGANPNHLLPILKNCQFASAVLAFRTSVNNTLEFHDYNIYEVNCY